MDMTTRNADVDARITRAVRNRLHDSTAVIVRWDKDTRTGVEYPVIQTKYPARAHACDLVTA